jgi:hypothetical protein
MQIETKAVYASINVYGVSVWAMMNARRQRKHLKKKFKAKGIIIIYSLSQVSGDEEKTNGADQLETRERDRPRRQKKT